MTLGIDAVAEVASRHDVVRLADIPSKVALLLRSERWSDAARTRWRARKLAELVAAARAIPAWRERLPAGPASIHDLPLLEREELQTCEDRLRHPDPGGPVAYQYTSGSSGRQVRVAHDPATVGYAAAARLRQRSWFGLPPRDLPQADLRTAAAGDPLVQLRREDPPSFWVNPFRLDEHTVAAAHAELAAAGGVRLLGARSSLFAQWAQAYERAGCDARELGARLAIVGGEMTHPDQRRAVEQVFGCPVAEMYGAHEIMMIACECAAGSLHVNEELVWLEVLRRDRSPAQPGERGEVVVTSLHNRTVPLVRYRLGDSAALLPGRCPCGRTLARVDLHVGRLVEMVRRRDGSLVHPGFLRAIYCGLFDDVLVAFHTVQEAIGAFTVHLHLRAPAPEGLAERLEHEIAAYLGEPATVRLEPAPVRPGAGKLSDFTCRIADPDG